MNTTIAEYKGGREEDVADLILSIQNGEAGLNLSIDDQPYLLDIANAYCDGEFWVAADGGGSIGLLTYGGSVAEFGLGPEPPRE